MADRYGVSIGQEIALQVQGKVVPVILTGLLQPDDPLSQRALEGLILTDIASAQEITGRIGKLDRVDLILPIDLEQPCSQSGNIKDSCLNSIQALLTQGLSI